MVGDLWVGKEIIKDDPNKQNQNRKLFQNYLIANPNLSVVNALPVCEGKITRKMTTTKGIETGILDFFVVCEKILPLVTKMIIDETGESTLTRYRGGKILKSDHNMLKMEISLTFHMDQKHERNEIFNLRNKICQKHFKEYTNTTDRFLKCFSTNESFKVQFNRWQRQFNKALHANFQKVRIKDNSDKKQSQLYSLINQRKDLLNKKQLNQQDLIYLELIENKIGVECEDRELKKLQKVLGGLSEGDGNSNIWRQMKKSFSKKIKPLPTGVKKKR